MKRCFFLLSVGLLFLFSGPAFCDDLIRKIQVEGNHRIESSTISVRSGLKEGHSYSRIDLNNALKKLFETGYFMDVRLNEEEGTLTILVEENPIVNQVVLEGNSAIEDKILESELRLKPRHVYTLSVLRQDAQRLQDIYRFKGHFAAQVTPEIIRRDQNRVDVIFKIKEGEATKVDRINFIGNTIFDEGTLEETIQTKEARWYRFFTTDDSYDPNRMEYDKDLLRQLYLEHGYVDFRVKSAVAELTTDQKSFFLTFTLYEGDRYRIGEIHLESKIKGVTEEELLSLLEVSQGDWYSSKSVERSVEAVTYYLGDRGFAFADVRPDVAKIEGGDSNQVSIRITVHESTPVYIDRIVIRGNDRTDEDVIRRELRLFEGDAFNITKLKESERRLRNLGFFKEVSIKQQTSDASDKLTLLIDVDEEPSTGELFIAGGIGSVEGVLAEIGMGERNLFGRGQQVEAKFKISKKVQDVDLTFVEPYFLNRPLQAGLNIYRTRQKKLLGSSFDERIFGARAFIGYELSQDLYQTLAYHIHQEKVEGVDTKASEFLRNQKGTATKSMISQKLTYDRLDSRLSPTEGYLLEMGNTFAGLGGTERHLSNIFKAGYYTPVWKDIVFSLRGSVGFLVGMGKKIRVADRYTLGGDSLRGFDFSGVGPRDTATGDALRGERYYSGTAEFIFPLGLPNEFGVKGSTFMDFGSLWKSGEKGPTVKEDKSIRASVGFGLNWRSPFGPMRFDFAWPLRKAKGDKTRTFLFGFSTRF
ncbi:MAG: outer membrane protein assembly factor BamA [bacterium]|nr:outer membrane protein assembly factor BamA [bacterium]